MGLPILHRRLADVAGLLFFFLATCATAAGYAPGEIVPMSRRGQYHNMRTEWHDTLGRHCPRFAVEREVVLPIPRPIGLASHEVYKMAFMVGQERFSTPWLLILGLKNTKVPMLDVTLTHFSGELRGVRAKVVSMPDEFIERHVSVAEHFHNVTHWPKHILIRYRWEEEAEVDVTAGLFVLFGTGFVLTTLLALYILHSSKEKLSRFVSEQITDASTPVMGPLEVAKAD
eukprot:TRINITY_DN17015_c0_g1_i1.p1 TRINITY_DN17015_c0_g1~~TRINITY_DN17015_c0_g1_i1.p1  ORF type:complete len:229 (-),score=43.51 TRINITY_DN17015_c0_g1_i1:1396-2082(-)